MRFLKKNNVSISVIIPAYNAERHIKNCLDSILNQTFKDFEIISINDCSTDRTLDILQKYSNDHHRIKLINNSINLGAGASRNRAINEAYGKYITFIDSDDWLSDDYLEHLHTEAEKTGADIVFSNMIMINEGVEHGFTEFNGLINKYRDNKASLLDLPVDWRSTAPWMKLFSKQFIVNSELTFQEGIRLGAEDIPFSWIAYFTANKIAFCDDVFYYYNLTEDSLDRSVSDNILQIFDALKFTEERYIRFDPDRSRISQLNFLFISQLTYQFSKITNSKTQRTIELASIFWKKAHEAMIQVTPINIIEHNRFSVDYLDFYIDLISHPDFDDEMQSKYLPD